MKHCYLFCTRCLFTLLMLHIYVHYYVFIDYHYCQPLSALSISFIKHTIVILCRYRMAAIKIFKKIAKDLVNFQFLRWGYDSQTDMKRKLWIEKANDFPNVDVEYLMCWYKSMRTCFGKLSRLPTELGAQELIKRDKGMLCKFSWLKILISRQRDKQLGGMTEKLSTAGDPSTSRRLSSGKDSDDDTLDVALDIQANCILSKVCHPQSCSPEVHSAISSAFKSKPKSKVKIKWRPFFPSKTLLVTSGCNLDCSSLV